MGDKIMYEPIIRYIHSHLKYDNILAVEWADDPLSFMEFNINPKISFVLHPLNDNELFGHWLDKINQKLLITYYTKDSELLNENNLWTKKFRWINLWHILYSLAKINYYPDLSNLLNENKLIKFANENGIDITKPYITLHLRKVRRDEEKNLDSEKYYRIADELVNRYDINIILVGTKEEKQNAISTNINIIDLRGKIKSLAILASIMKNAIVHIGGDSGPTHLAAAVKANIITVNRRTSKVNSGYGPFGSNSIYKYKKEDSTSEKIILAVGNIISDKHNKETGNINAEGSHSSINILGESYRTEYTNAEEINQIKCFASLNKEGCEPSTVQFSNYLLKQFVPDAFFVPIRIKSIKHSIDILKDLPIEALSIAQPFQDSILSYADIIDDNCMKIGAANTIYKIDNKWVAQNTLWEDIVNVLSKRLFLHDSNVLVYGTGSTAKAACYGLLMNKAKVTIAGEAIPNILEIVKNFKLDNYYLIGQKLKIKCDIFINTTSYSSENKKSYEFLNKLIPIETKILVDCLSSKSETILSHIAQERKLIYVSAKEIYRMQAIHQILKYKAIATNNIKIGDYSNKILLDE